MSETQPEEGDEIYIIPFSKYIPTKRHEIVVGVFCEYENELGEKHPQVLHTNSTPTSIEHIEYWSYSIKTLKNKNGKF